jgi:hypothetical protein
MNIKNSSGSDGYVVSMWWRRCGDVVAEIVRDVVDQKEMWVNRERTAAAQMDT